MNIAKVAGTQLTIEVPQVPDTTFLTQLEEEWKVILIQLLLHKRMSSERVARLIYAGNLEHTDRILKAMGCEYSIIIAILHRFFQMVYAIL